LLFGSSLFCKEQKTWLHHDRSNERKRVTRLGETEDLSIRLEKLVMINAFATEAGFTNLPFPDLLTPRVQHNEEFMGLAYELPDSFKAPVDPGDEDVLAEFLEGLDWSDDLPLDVTQFQADYQQRAAANDMEEEAPMASILETGPKKERLQEKLTLDMVSLNRVEPIARRETTFKFFERLVQAPWVPFCSLDSSTKTALDEEES
jgi:hypothetical protein